MKILSKVLSLIIVTFMIFSLTSNSNFTFAISSLNVSDNKIANVAVLLYSYDDISVLQLKQLLENIQKNNNKVHFTFFDGKNNISLQYETFDSVLNDNYNLFILNLADVREDTVKNFISKAKLKNTPLILLEIDPLLASKLSKDYNKAAFVTLDSKLTGTIEARILSNLWNTNRKAIDKNGDNILQYILLDGKANNPIAIDRKNSAISELKNSGIATEQLAIVNANWLKELAKNSIDSLFLQYNGKIEAIIVNNDAMAIGAIEALQKYGYNKGDKSKNIAVVGIDGSPEAIELINKGFMTGTVIIDQEIVSEALYTIGMNMINNINPIENTNYKLSDSEIIIPTGFKEYTSMTKPE
ncbi:D-galactose-binding periplasmic protein precursor [Clostridium sp. DL-VIII]|uniref:galactose ABC transporter substrate-binding protein n=1 Tax=Clostridium sp. DL-VIII TaxID=641107 RepID=UPI00023B00DF|nr:galactose ABC transporter substrate-binding protein [Clostridium sp. DL-VIII]EHI99200.1 D-galactose-binding periplasmic protein precursor [Clostridium sp. DL-VIII]